MTYHAKLPFCLYQKHFQTPKGVTMDKFSSVKIIVEFVVIDDDFERMKLKWRCPRLFKFGILDEDKCKEIKVDIFKWIRWVSKDSFSEYDLL